MYIALRIIYEQYRRKVYSYALKIIKSTELVEDIVHEVFLRIGQHPDAGEIEHLDPYLRIVTRNYTFSHEHQSPTIFIDSISRRYSHNAASYLLCRRKSCRSEKGESGL